jgi:16S rRNA (uracil1498-N3)-methyltransferase
MFPRLYTATALAVGGRVSLGPDRAHYLKNVLRREAGAEIKLFNARDGEFAATVAELTKKIASAEIVGRLRTPEPEPDILVLLAPVKRTPLELVIQKATELGAAGFAPVLTDRTNADRVNTDRLSAIALEAAEQCGRLSIPTFAECTRLVDALLHWDKSRQLIYCDEAGDDPTAEWGGPYGRAGPLYDVVKEGGLRKAALLIGPEGGFSPDERRWLRSLPFVSPVTLGPRILRADTAAIVSLALWQAAVGDLTQS